MKILLTGATGLIASAFMQRFPEHQYLTVSRQAQHADIGYTDLIKQDTDTINNLRSFAPDAIINLAGEPIADKRWSAKQKANIEQSRWQITQVLSQLIIDGHLQPQVFLSGSAIGIYGRQGEQEITEDYPHRHIEFSHQLCSQWEALALQAKEKCRVVTLRTGIVLSATGGALAKMVPPFKFGLGGPMGNGQQYMSWIHIEDMLQAIEFCLHQPITGPVNMTAPQPVTNKVFSQTLAKRLRRPCLFTIPSFSLRLLMGESADLLLFGQRVIPKQLLDHNFNFQYPELTDALANLNL